MTRILGFHGHGLGSMELSHGIECGVVSVKQCGVDKKKKEKKFKKKEKFMTTKIYWDIIYILQLNQFYV